jgi:hypothetical protein
LELCPAIAHTVYVFSSLQTITAECPPLGVIIGIAIEEVLSVTLYIITSFVGVPPEKPPVM